MEENKNTHHQLPPQKQNEVAVEIEPQTKKLVNEGGDDSLVVTAVKFLRNPQVQSKPLDHKKTFLRSKGLTEQQIQRAIAEAGVTEYNPNVPQYQSYPPITVQQQLPVPFLTKFRNASFIVVIVCSTGYGLYRLYKDYIKPYLFQEKTSQNSLDESIKNLTLTVKQMQDTLNENENKIKEIVATSQSINQNSLRTREFQELKTEITSLKGLMLNRSSFPPPPNLVGSGVPSWQLQQNNDGNHGNSSGEEQMGSGRSWEVVNEETEEKQQMSSNSTQSI